MVTHMTMLSARIRPELYEKDETAWLETMVQLIAEGRLEELDFLNLQEYLGDMARRDRREVVSRLSLLLSHRLKWDYQTDRRCPSWKTTIEVQRQELLDLLESGTLRNHALDILAKAYANGAKQAEAETGISLATFPTECPYSVEDLLAEGWMADSPSDSEQAP